MFFFFAVLPCLWRGNYLSSGNEPAENNSVTPMLRHLISKIKSTGPITVAEYMKEVLTNPAKVWVGAPGHQAHSSSAVGCAQRSPRALSPGGSLPGQESGLKTFSSVQSLSHVRLFATSWTAARQDREASYSFHCFPMCLPSSDGTGCHHSSGHRTGKVQFSFQSQRKAMPKNAQTTTLLHSSHMLAKQCS